MHPLVLLALVALIIFFVYAQLVWLAFLLGLVIVADLLGGFTTRLIGGIATLIGAIFGAASTEQVEMDRAKPKAPEGKKFFEKSLERTGKSLGKAEKAKSEGKKVKDKRDDWEKVGEAADEFLKETGKLFRR